MMVTYTYPVPKERIALLITVEKKVEITFVVVAPLGNSLELYIDASVENPPYVSL